MAYHRLFALIICLLDLFISICLPLHMEKSKSFITTLKIVDVLSLKFSWLHNTYLEKSKSFKIILKIDNVLSLVIFFYCKNVYLASLLCYFLGSTLHFLNSIGNQSAIFTFSNSEQNGINFDSSMFSTSNNQPCNVIDSIQNI